LGLRETFSFKQDEVIGLDIGSSAVKLVRLRKNSAGYAVTAAGISNIAPAGDDVSRKRLNTVRAIQECLAVTGVRNKLAVCGVGGPEVAVRDFRFPAMPPEEVAGAVSLEAAQVCPFNMEDGAIDYELMAGNGGAVAGILVAATHSLVKRKVQIVKESSLDCVMMDAEGMALLNCFSELERPEPGQTIAILNIGSSYTTLAIMGGPPPCLLSKTERGAGWPFIRDLTFAGDDIVKLIAAEHEMSPDAAKDVLFSDSDQPQTTLHDSLEEVCKKLIVDVFETSRYYKAQEKSAAFEKLFVCGGFALVKGFVELLSSQLPVKAVLWNPFEKMRCEVGRNHRGAFQRNILQKNSPAMVVACGLAMRSI
jgi:type IV pilus assembly protein PilM